MLLKNAMELSVLCECSVAVILFAPDGKLVQFSSFDDMDTMLERYAHACQRPHERYTNEDVGVPLAARMLSWRSMHAVNAQHPRPMQLLKDYVETGCYDDTSMRSVSRKRAVRPLAWGVAHACRHEHVNCSTATA